MFVRWSLPFPVVSELPSDGIVGTFICDSVAVVKSTEEKDKLHYNLIEVI